MDEEQKNAPKDFPSKKPPVALFVWLFVFAVIVMFLLMRFNPGVKSENWEQSRFETELAAGRIISVKLTPETDRVMTAEGKFRRGPAELEPPKDTAPEADAAKKTSSAAEAKKLEGFFTARVILSETLDTLLRKQESLKLTIENPSPWWKGLFLPILTILFIVGIYFLFSRQIKMAGRGAMQFGRSKARMILPDEHKTKFDDIAGADEAKEETKEVVDYLKDPIKYKLVGGKIPKGALLTGPPGTGKTLMAKAVAGEANVPFFAISGSDFVEMFVGVGASRVRDMFDQARRHAPCLIFIDEIDAVGRSRFTGIGGGHDEREQTLNALLVEMDGLETQEGVIVLAATNRPDVLDPALMRPGRFDRQIFLDLPDIRGRRKILEVHAKNIKLSKEADLDVIARGTPGFSGADLANLINEAALLAARNNRDAAGMEDLEEARDKVRWGRERRSRKISDRERKLTAYHEAGHTIVSLHCPDALPLHKVTIIPRGRAYLGATMQLPEEDRYTESKQEMLDEIAILMGGRCAEEIIFGDVTSGASSDIEQATRVSRMMVCAFGMSDKLGTVQYGERGGHIYLGRDIVKNEAYSEDTAREIDLEIKRIVDEAKARALNILKTNKDQLEKLSVALLDQESMDVKEIRALLGLPEPEAKKTETPETPAPASVPDNKKEVGPRPSSSSSFKIDA